MKQAHLVLGATGFLGINLCRNLLSQGIEVIACGRDLSRLPDDLAKQVRTLNIDGWTHEQWSNPDKDINCSAITNCIAYGVRPSDQDNSAMRAVNVDLPLRVAELAKALSATFVHLGSFSEYAAMKDLKLLNENSAIETQKPYGATKHQGGEQLASKCKHEGIKSLNLRLFHVYGPEEAEHRLLPTLISQLSNGTPVDLSAGTQVRDFVYVDDVCDAIIVAHESLLKGALDGNSTYNIATGQGTSVADFARLTARILKVDLNLLKFGVVNMRPGEVGAAYMVGESKKFQLQTGWSPAHNVESGIGSTIEKWQSKFA